MIYGEEESRALRSNIRAGIHQSLDDIGDENQIIGGQQTKSGGGGSVSGSCAGTEFGGHAEKACNK